jgi:hypothetical protein
MKQFLIRYRRTEGSPEDWHREIGKFIAAIDSDPALKGKIGYRCLKVRDGADYFHIATVHDESGRVALQDRDFFKHYTQATRAIAGGVVEVTPIETVAETVS